MLIYSGPDVIQTDVQRDGVVAFSSGKHRTLLVVYWTPDPGTRPARRLESAKPSPILLMHGLAQLPMDGWIDEQWPRMHMHVWYAMPAALHADI